MPNFKVNIFTASTIPGVVEENALRKDREIWDRFSKREKEKYKERGLIPCYYSPIFFRLGKTSY